MSCGRIALERANIPVGTYYSSEIDKYAIQVADKNYPQDTAYRLGDVTTIDASVETAPHIDLLIGGSPCQGFSFIGKQLNFEDPRSKLFFEFSRLLKELKPKYFLLENVKMKKESQDIITSYLGVEPIEINSALVSAQDRKRLYWTNIPNIVQPEDRKIVLKAILEKGTDLSKYKISKKSINTYIKDVTAEYCDPYNKTTNHRTKSTTLRLNSSNGNMWVNDKVFGWRRLTPLECERLQTVPENYTSTVSDSQRYKMLGNGWTVAIIAHILSFIPEDER